MILSFAEKAILPLRGENSFLSTGCDLFLSTDKTRRSGRKFHISEIFFGFWTFAAKSVRLGVAHPHDDALREIAEFFAEQVDAADVRRVRVNTDAQGDVFQRVELQIRDGDA